MYVGQRPAVARAVRTVWRKLVAVKSSVMEEVMRFKLQSQPICRPSRPGAQFTLPALVVLSALLLCSVAFAQTSVSNGSISGTVTDASGAVVPNAKVTMTGPTGQTVHAMTSGAGTYSSG